MKIADMRKSAYSMPLTNRLIRRDRTAPMREHWDAGYEDTQRTLRHPEWLMRSSISDGVAVHDLHREDPT